jgi:hypothetical protein
MKIKLKFIDENHKLPKGKFFVSWQFPYEDGKGLKNFFSRLSAGVGMKNIYLSELSIRTIEEETFYYVRGYTK